MTCSECEYYMIVKAGWCKCTGGEIDRKKAEHSAPWWCPLKDKENDGK